MAGQFVYGPLPGGAEKFLHLPKGASLELAEGGWCTVLHRREFQHRGVGVLEYIYQWGPQMKKLMWIRTTVPERADGDVPCPLAHVDIMSREGTDLSASELTRTRASIELSFNDYWKL